MLFGCVRVNQFEFNNFSGNYFVSLSLESVSRKPAKDADETSQTFSIAAPPKATETFEASSYLSIWDTL